VAELWQFSVETVRRLFRDEPGVMVLKAPIKKNKGAHTTQSAHQQVFLEHLHKRSTSKGRILDRNEHAKEI
jgi:hypothetical protein